MPSWAARCSFAAIILLVSAFVARTVVGTTTVTVWASATSGFSVVLACAIWLQRKGLERRWNSLSIAERRIGLVVSLVCGVVTAVGTSTDIHTTHPPVIFHVEALSTAESVSSWDLFDFQAAGELPLDAPDVAITGAGEHTNGKVVMTGAGLVAWNTPSRGVPAVRLRTTSTVPIKVHCNGVEKTFSTIETGPIEDALLWCPIAITDAATFIARAVLLCQALTAAVAALLLWCLLAERTANLGAAAPRAQTRAGITIFLISLVPLTFYFAAFFPGTMSSDSLDQWAQALGLRQLGDAHPITHTMLVRAASLFGESPATFVAFQIVAVCASFATLVSIARYGRRAWAAVSWIALATACCPPVGFFSVAIWKDVLFSAACLCFVVAVTTVAIDSALARSWAWRWGFVLSGLSVLLLRHNGISTVLFGTAALVCVFKSHRLFALALSACILVIGFGTRAVLTRVLDATPSPAYAVYARPMQDIAAGLRAGLELDPADKAALERIAPVSVWKGAFVPATAGGLLFAPNFDRTAIEDAGPDLRRIWFSTIASKPMVVLEEELKMLSLFWQTIPPSDGYTATVPRGIDANSLDLRTEPLIENAHDFLMWLLAWSEQRSTIWLLWRPVIWLLAIALCVAATSLRNRSVATVSAAPMLGHLAGLIPTLPAQDVRYFLPLLLCLPAYVLLALLDTKELRRPQVIG